MCGKICAHTHVTQKSNNNTSEGHPMNQLLTARIRALQMAVRHSIVGTTRDSRRHHCISTCSKSMSGIPVYRTSSLRSLELWRKSTRPSKLRSCTHCSTYLAQRIAHHVSAQLRRDGSSSYLPRGDPASPPRQAGRWFTLCDET